MLQRDYFIRIIEEFMAALGRFLEKKVDERSDEDLKELYRQYVGSYDVLRNLSFKEILQYAGNSTAPMSAYSVSTCLLNFSTLRGHTRMLLSRHAARQSLPAVRLR